jgi:hypothetical protein
MFKRKAKEITEESRLLWDNSGYSKFLKQANVNELLRSQMPFFYAVEAFPLMLIKLAGMINSPSARCLIVENIWEEHGQGDSNKFHTNSFNNHLKSLGFNDEYIKNPFVTNWIEDIIKSDSATHLFHELAAIEYMYAVISETIADKLSNTPLLSDQDHYLKHSEIDWSHGEDILISMAMSDIEFDATKFKFYQLKFINLFSKLIVPTQKEVAAVAKSTPVSFYYTRECTDVIESTLDLISKSKLDVLAICSGGENIIHYLGHDSVLNVTAFDMNPTQIELCKEKLSMSKSGIEFENGKFEYLFSLVRSYFTNTNNQITILDTYNGDNEVLDYVIDLVFDDWILTALFTEEATKYSKQSFSDHFKLVYKAMIIKNTIRTDENSQNILLGKEIINKHQANAKCASVNFINAGAQDALQSGTFDIIDLSNIGDWMPYEEFSALLLEAYNKLNKGGFLILRRLLGDYKLANIEFGFIINITDSTCFYSETVAIRK